VRARLAGGGGLEDCDVVIAATGDDKVNLVVSLLAKTEFAVRRVVARVNDPTNEWLFDGSWGVDVAVSTPRLLAALVEEAVAVGDLVRLMTLRQGQANLVEVTLPAHTPLAGAPVRSLKLPPDSALVVILRGGRVIVPQGDDALEAGDELLFVATSRGGGRHPDGARALARPSRAIERAALSPAGFRRPCRRSGLVSRRVGVRGGRGGPPRSCPAARSRRSG
jgi:hypothetical protein